MLDHATDHDDHRAAWARRFLARVVLRPRPEAVPAPFPQHLDRPADPWTQLCHELTAAAVEYQRASAAAFQPR